MRAILSSISLTLICLTVPANSIGQQPAEPILERDIVYGKAGDRELRLDLMKPAAGKPPFPLVVCLHAGGWVMGDRAGDHAALRDLVKQGIAAATVQYRLAPAYTFPAQLDDAKKALAFLRTNAARLGVDSGHIAVAGGSAGGHLSLLLGLQDKGAPPVRAIVDIMGPADFPSWRIDKDANDLMRRSMGVDLDALLVDFVGTSDRQDRRMVEASPTHYVHAGNPAVLILHGTADTWVPFQQAQTLYDALKRAGVKAKLVPLVGGNHFFWPPAEGEKFKREMAAFLKQELLPN